MTCGAGSERAWPTSGQVSAAAKSGTSARGTSRCRLSAGRPSARPSRAGACTGRCDGASGARTSPCPRLRGRMPDEKTGPRALAELVDRWFAEGRLVGGQRPVEDAKGGAGVTITGVQDDSRQVARGNLFVAVKGLRVDGHDFVDEAVQRGAAAVAVERPV